MGCLVCLPLRMQHNSKNGNYVAQILSHKLNAHAYSKLNRPYEEYEQFLLSSASPSR
jgi:hypothetical protein